MHPQAIATDDSDLSPTGTTVCLHAVSMPGEDRLPSPWLASPANGISPIEVEPLTRSSSFTSPLKSPSGLADEQAGELDAEEGALDIERAGGTEEPATAQPAMVPAREAAGIALDGCCEIMMVKPADTKDGANLLSSGSAASAAAFPSSSSRSSSSACPDAVQSSLRSSLTLLPEQPAAAESPSTNTANASATTTSTELSLGSQAAGWLPASLTSVSTSAAGAAATSSSSSLPTVPANSGHAPESAQDQQQQQTDLQRGKTVFARLHSMLPVVDNVHLSSGVSRTRHEPTRLGQASQEQAARVVWHGALACTDRPHMPKCPRAQLITPSPASCVRLLPCHPNAHSIPYPLSTHTERPRRRSAAQHHPQSLARHQ